MAANAPDLSAVFHHVDEHRQDFLDRLFDYVSRPSISAHGLGIAEVAAYIEAGTRRPARLGRAPVGGA